LLFNYSKHINIKKEKEKDGGDQGKPDVPLSEGKPSDDKT
jgi:hypothetical protein